MSIEGSTKQTPKRTEVFHRPNPYDIVVLTATFDDRNIEPPPPTYFPAINAEKQLSDVTKDLQDAFGERLMLVALTGSRVDHPERENRDLDVLAIVDDNAAGDKITFHGDLKIASYSGLKEFIESGYQLITTQFRKAQPLYQREGAQPALDEAKTWKVLPEKAIPFLIAKSKFNEQTSDILKLMSEKYHAISLHQQGFANEAFQQLLGIGQDELFVALHQNGESVEPDVYAKLSIFYANVG